MSTRIRFRFIPSTGVAEAKCLVCSWTLTTTDLDLIDALRMDARDHRKDCHQRSY